MTEPTACHQLREGLTEYLEDALPPARRQGVEAHLARCGECRRLLLQLRPPADSLPREPMPAAMKQRLLQAFRDRPTP